MSTSRLALAALVLLACGPRISWTADKDFRSLAREVSRRYATEETHVPMMGFVSLCTRVATLGGVRGLQVTEFDNMKEQLDLNNLKALLRETLSSDWQPFVNESSQGGKEQSVIFVRPTGNAIRMLIADFNSGELDLVRLELKAKAWAKWMNNSGERPHRWY